jgi:hypothetical protein
MKSLASKKASTRNKTKHGNKKSPLFQLFSLAIHLFSPKKYQLPGQAVPSDCDDTQCRTANSTQRFDRKKLSKTTI